MSTAAQNTTTYTRTSPFVGRLKQRYALTKTGSKKRTDHIVVGLEGSGITYSPGDSVGVIPENAAELVNLTLKAMHCTGDELVTDKRREDTISLCRFLTERANICTVPRSLAQRVAEQVPDSPLTPLLPDRKLLKEHLSQRFLWDFLAEHPDARLSAEEICQSLQPLIPRLYSIASSQAAEANEVHLTVAYVAYESNGHKRHGVATEWLCNALSEGSGRIPLYIQPANKFSLPKDPTVPVIMIGPGTGVAPFRAFMQERVAVGAGGPAWLFFGEWTQEHEFFYEEEWMTLVESGHLKVDTAFSRDQTEKIYVQDRIRENGKAIWEWLEKGACVYVCGDASRMAKDVEATLVDIIAEHADLSEEDAKAHLKELRHGGRYMKDVY